MLRRTGFALSFIVALLTALALASYAPAQEAEDPATTTQDQAQQDGDGGAEDPDATEEAGAQGDDPFDELPEAPAEDETAGDGGQQETAGAQDENGTGGTEAGADRDCEDFDTQADAQDYFTDEGGDDLNNVDDLDEDGDGVVCEALGAPSGGVDAGGGGTAVRPVDSGGGLLPFLLGGAVLGLAAGALSLVARRRRVGA
jgi:hypothetical protein